jgi:hypothetical protein
MENLKDIINDVNIDESESENDEYENLEECFLDQCRHGYKIN